MAQWNRSGYSPIRAALLVLAATCAIVAVMPTHSAASMLGRLAWEGVEGAEVETEPPAIEVFLVGPDGRDVPAPRTLKLVVDDGEGTCEVSIADLTDGVRDEVGSDEAEGTSTTTVVDGAPVPCRDRVAGADLVVLAHEEAREDGDGVRIATNVTVSDESIVVRAPLRGPLLVAETSDSEETVATDGPVKVVVPSEACGQGYAERGVIVLLFDEAECDGAKRVAIALPGDNPATYEIDTPTQLVDPRSVIDLSARNRVTKRGGSVLLQPVDGNPVPAQPGLRISFAVDGDTCGTSDVNENGAYAVALDPPCADRVDAEVVMIDTTLATTRLDLGTGSVLDAVFEVPDGRLPVMSRALLEEGAAVPIGQTFTVTGRSDRECGQAKVQREGGFLLLTPTECTGSMVARLSDGLEATFSIAEDGSTGELVFTGATEQDPPPSSEREDSLLSGSQILGIMVGILLVALVGIYARWNVVTGGSGMRRLLVEASKNPQEADLAAIKDLIEARKPPASLDRSFNLALLAVVTVALVTLTLGGTVTEQGVLTILGAIVGYTAGRSASS